MKQFQSYSDISHLPSSLAGKVRADQISMIAKLTPLIMFGNIVSALSIVDAYWGSPKRELVLLWAAIFLTLVSINMANWHKYKQSDPKHWVSSQAINRACNYSIILGIVWAILPLMVFIDATPEQELLLGSVMPGVLCVGGFSLSSIPRASYGFIIPVTVGCFISLLMCSGLVHIELAVLLLLYAIAVYFTANNYGTLFIQQRVQQINAEYQKDLVSLLLRDFEENTSDTLWEVDDDNCLVNVSDKFSVKLVDDPDNVIGKNLLHLLAGHVELHDVEGEARLEELTARMAAREPFRDVVVTLKLGQEEAWWSFTGKPHYSQDNKFSGYRGVCADMTASKLAERRIEHIARHDPLTSLPNRRVFRETLEADCYKISQENLNFAVICLDIDKFKIINEMRGQPAGDQLLIEVAKRIGVSAEKFDSFVARSGGDEFSILLYGENPSHTAAKISHEILNRFIEPINLNGTELMVGISVGVVVAPVDGATPDLLLNNVNLALHRAKEDGRGVVRFFEANMDAGNHRRREFEFDLGYALANNEFSLNYQPLVDTKTEQVQSFEALIRWVHPEYGIVSPAEFVPIAEETGRIKEIGQWVLEEACQQAANWPGNLKVAVNLSPVQFEDDEVVEAVRHALNYSGLDAARLELEVTEGLLINESEDLLRTLQKLKGIGVSIAMDDFGTGFSSLSYLCLYPFDKLKIDRSFINDLASDNTVKHIVETIAALGKTLKLCITAEGVETREQADSLKELDCDQLQGYLFSKPLATNDVAGYLLKNFQKANLPEENLTTSDVIEDNVKRVTNLP